MKSILASIVIVPAVLGATQWVYPSNVKAPICQKFIRKGTSRYCAAGSVAEGTWPGSDANKDKQVYGCLDLEKPICPNDDTWALQWDATNRNSMPFWAKKTLDEDSCGDPALRAQWQRKEYQYTCCKCPQGYFSPSTICNWRLPGQKCMRCTFRDWMVRDPKTGKLECRKYQIEAKCKAAEWVMFMIIKSEDEKSTVDKPVFHEDWFNGGEEKGDNKHTIGYGHQCLVNNDCDKITAPITESQARTLLVNDVAKAEQAVSSLPNIHMLNENQYAVLIDLAYNAGPGVPGIEFGELLAAEKFSEIADKLPTTRINVLHKDGTSETLDGLVKRRLRMQNLWNTPADKMSGCPRRIVYDPDSADPPPIPVLNEAGIPVFGEGGVPVPSGTAPGPDGSGNPSGDAAIPKPPESLGSLTEGARSGLAATGFVSLEDEISSFDEGDQKQWHSTAQWEIEERAKQILADIASTWRYVTFGKEAEPSTTSSIMSPSTLVAHAEL